MLKPHHVIFFCQQDGPEADDLLSVGLVEGTGNVHLGQGTANRRFFFRFGFIELLWVHDEQEARSKLVAPTRLWERWEQREGIACPYGLCFSSATGIGDGLPFPAWPYCPSYLPHGRSLLFAESMPMSEPEVFVLSWPQDQTPPDNEPVEHQLGLGGMRSVSLGVPEPNGVSNSLGAATAAGMLQIHPSPSPSLIIEFDAQVSVEIEIPKLGLTLRGREAEN
ncbi:MAG: hypothetical protein AAF358_21460 [Pseudomonadota bacterium]